MGKQVKVNLENNEEKKEETKMEENKEVKTVETAAANEAHDNLPAAPAKEKKNPVAKLWNDGGIVGKGVVVLGGTAAMVAVGFGIKLLVGYFFGPEAAEAIDPTALVPTEE